jgi:hypothetical protein
VAATDVVPILYQWAERGAEASLVPAAGAFPDDWIVPDGEPFYVVEGGVLPLPVVFQRESDGMKVAWDTTAVEVAVVTIEGEAPDVAVPDPGWITVTPVAGGTSEVQVTDGTEQWVAGTLVGVPAEVASIEVVVALIDEGEGATSPYAARAVLRDAGGRLLYGAPVSWEMTGGELEFELDDTGVLGPDYVLLAEACTAPPTDAPETRTATLEARFGGVSASATFEWVAAVSTAPFVPDPECPGEPTGDVAEGCTCNQGGVPWLGIAMVVTTLARRRRRSR